MKFLLKTVLEIARIPKMRILSSLIKESPKISYEFCDNVLGIGISPNDLYYVYDSKEENNYIMFTGHKGLVFDGGETKMDGIIHFEKVLNYKIFDKINDIDFVGVIYSEDIAYKNTTDLPLKTWCVDVREIHSKRVELSNDSNVKTLRSKYIKVKGENVNIERIVFPEKIISKEDIKVDVLICEKEPKIKGPVEVENFIYI